MKYNFDGHKMAHHMERVYDHFRDGKRIYPLHIDLGATKLCQARCVYCYGTFQKMSGDIVPRNVLLNLFEDAPKLGVKSMTITGDGEPNLNPAVYDACIVGKRNGLDIGFATNGILLDDKQMITLLQNCTWVRFNLSGVDRESYKKIHGVDKWEVVSKNIWRMVRLKKDLKSNCTLGLQMVLIPDALDQVIPEAKLAVSTGVDYFVIKQFSDPGCEELSRFALSWYDNKETLAILKIAEAMSTEETKIVPKWGTMHSKGVKQYDHCVDCPLLFQISGTSKCYPCGFLFGNEKYCYGDLKKQSLKEILDSEHYWSIIKYMREEFDVHTQCTGCCRHDAINTFMWQYLQPVEHKNFI
jgi:MoaA/NifB/PqqE/SkfB family radical SAM enzyme